MTETEYEHQAYVDRIVAKAPPATEEDIDWLRNTIRAGREQAARTTKAS